MAIVRFRRTVYKSGGRSASARLAYITRQPSSDISAAERQLRYVREDCEDLVFERSRNLPAWAKDNPHIYFQAAEKYEGQSRVAFEEWKIALPQELSHRQNLDLMKDLVDAIAGTRLPITYAVHDPKTMDGTQQQPHLHLLISARQNDAHTRTPAQHFKRYDRAHPARGGAEKDPVFWHRGAIKAHRVLITDIVNLHLEQAGQAGRVHPERLAAQGLARKPEPKLYPSESRDYREQGIISTRMQHVLDIRAEREKQIALEHNEARRYWEARKAELGITRAMPMPEKLAQVSAARQQSITHAPPRRSREDLQREEQMLTRSIRGLERHLDDLQQVHAWETRIEQRRERRDWKGELAVERVLARGKRHGLGVDPIAERAVAQLTRLITALEDDEPGQGARLNIRLQEQDHSHDHGIGW